jgi:cell division protease FtsH
MPSRKNKDLLEKLTDKIRSFMGQHDPKKVKDAVPPKAQFSIWYALAAILLFTYLQQYFFSAKVETIPYSQFKQYIAEGKLAKLTIGPENINGTLAGQPGQAFATIRVDDPDLVKELDERNVSYSGRYENKFLSSLLSWIIPLGIFFSDLAICHKKDWAGDGGHVLRQEQSQDFRRE